MPQPAPTVRSTTCLPLIIIITFENQTKKPISRETKTRIIKSPINLREISEIKQTKKVEGIGDRIFSGADGEV
jgi:hypothetical protein